MPGQSRRLSKTLHIKPGPRTRGPELSPPDGGLGTIPDDHFTAIAGTNYEVGYVELDDASGEGDCVDGAQFISADKPIGVMVAGLDWATSYGYPGGLNFKALWVPPTEPPT